MCWRGSRRSCASGYGKRSISQQFAHSEDQTNRVQKRINDDSTWFGMNWSGVTLIGEAFDRCYLFGNLRHSSLCMKLDTLLRVFVYRDKDPLINLSSCLEPEVINRIFYMKRSFNEPSFTRIEIEIFLQIQFRRLGVVIHLRNSCVIA